MDLSPPTLGAMTGIGIVLLISVIARRSERRAQEQRLRLIQDRIKRRQETLAAQQAPHRDRNVPDEDAANG